MGKPALADEEADQIRGRPGVFGVLEEDRGVDATQDRKGLTMGPSGHSIVAVFSR
jgi:hypothetical protein